MGGFLGLTIHKSVRRWRKPVRRDAAVIYLCDRPVCKQVWSRENIFLVPTTITASPHPLLDGTLLALMSVESIAFLSVGCSRLPSTRPQRTPPFYV